MAHSRSPGYDPGNHWVVCMRCGFDYRANEIVKDKQKPGLLVCRDCFDGRHPQEFVRSVPERMTPQGPVFPPPTEVFEDRDFADQQVTVPSGTFNTNNETL